MFDEFKMNPMVPIRWKENNTDTCHPKKISKLLPSNLKKKKDLIDIVLRSRQWFGRYMITLCLYHEPPRQQGHTVSHLIPSHSGKPCVFTAQTLIQNGNHKKTSTRHESILITFSTRVNKYRYYFFHPLQIGEWKHHKKSINYAICINAQMTGAFNPY